MNDMEESIKKFFKGDVDTSDETLTKYSHDASIFEVRPQIVVYPKDSSDISQLVKWVNEQNTARQDLVNKLSITVRAAGTCMSGGAIGESIIMDTTRYMNKISNIKKVRAFNMQPKYPNAHMVEITGEAIVEPGCFYRGFEEETLYELLLFEFIMGLVWGLGLFLKGCWMTTPEITDMVLLFSVKRPELLLGHFC